MIRPMTQAALTALALSLALPAAAQGVYVQPLGGAVSSTAPLTGQRADIARELRRYGYGDVDVRRLSSGQVAQIYHAIYSGRSEGDIRGIIGSTLRRGFLQRGIDRIFRQ